MRGAAQGDGSSQPPEHSPILLRRGGRGGVRGRGRGRRAQGVRHRRVEATQPLE